MKVDHGFNAEVLQFSSVGKSEAVEKMEREKWGQKVSRRICKKFLSNFWMILSVLSTLENAFFSLLAYYVCSSRAIKSVGIIICEAACDPCCFFLPSSP